jgi:S-layer homology domain
MKKVLVRLSLFALLFQAAYPAIVLAQSNPSRNPLAPDNYELIDWGLSTTGRNKSTLTEVRKIEDLRSTDSYYLAVQSLTERFGVMYVYNDGKFHAELDLTRAQLASFLNGGFDRLNELLAASNADTDKQKVELRQVLDLYSLYNKPRSIDSTAQIKDVNQTDPYFANLQSLTERYGIDLTDADNYFRPRKTVTTKEFYTLMKGVVGYEPSNPKIVNNRAMTRGEFIMAFNSAIEYTVEKINWMSTKH